MTDIVIDTDVASLLLRRREPAWVKAQLAGARVWLTFVTVGELRQWAAVRSWGTHRRDELAQWMARRPILPYDPATARKWGELAAAARARGRRRPQNDTWIAACCIHQRVPLLTHNDKDFADFAAFDGLTLVRQPV